MNNEPLNFFFLFKLFKKENWTNETSALLLYALTWENQFGLFNFIFKTRYPIHQPRKLIPPFNWGVLFKVIAKLCMD